MKPNRGLTLIEGLFSLLLVMLVLGALAKTLVNAGRVRSNRENMDRAGDELHVLQTIRADIVNGLELAEPAEGLAGSQIRVRMIRPDLSFTQRIDPLQGPELPFETAEQTEVLYHLQDGSLTRTVTPSDLPASSLKLLAASGFQASRENSLVTLTLDFDYSRVTKSRVLKVDLR